MKFFIHALLLHQL